MHLIAPLAAGMAGAASGTARIYVRGTSTRASYYTDFEGGSTSTADITLDANGRAIVYVSQLVTVQVTGSAGTTVATFDDGYNASAVEVISQSFTGTNYSTAASAASQPATLASVLDLWKTNAGNASGSIDWKVSLSGTAKTIASWLSQTANVIINVKDAAYGAVGDGSTDDSSAIQAALTAASGYGIVFFPAGNYKVDTSLTIPIGVAGLAGLGTLKSQISLGATAGISVTNTYGLHVSGLKIAAYTANSIANIFSFTAATVDSANAVVFEDCIFGDDTYSNQNQLLNVTGSVANLVVSRCIFVSNNSSGTDLVIGATARLSTVVRDCEFVFCGTVSNRYAIQQSSTATNGHTLIDGCVFDYADATSGTTTYVMTSTGGAHVVNNRFCAGGGATVRAIEASTLGAGEILYENGNHFEDTVTRYVYDSTDRDNVAFCTRDQPNFGSVNVTVTGAGGSTISADQYGFMHFTAGAASDASQTLTLSEGCRHQRFRIAITNQRATSVAITWAGRVVAVAGDLTVDVASGLTQVFDFQALYDGSNYEWFLVQLEASNTEVAI